MTSGATEQQLDEVEAALGTTLPPSLRALLGTENGSEGWYGECFLMIYGTENLVAVNQELVRPEGFLAFASDGGREIVGLDTRHSPSPVVMLSITESTWDATLLQAGSLDEFMDQRRRGEDFRWNEGYE